MKLLPPQSEKLLRLALNHAAPTGEWQTAAVKFIASLREAKTQPESIIDSCSDKPKKKPLPYFMPFGQYKGMPLSKIPVEYLIWIVSKIEGKPELVHAAEMELEARA